MAIDTKPTMLERIVEARKDRARFKRKKGAETTMELIVDEPAAATRPSLDALLTHLDDVFHPLMEKARAKRADSSAPSSDQSGGPPPIESDVSPEDQVKLDGFLATCLQPPPLAVKLGWLTDDDGAGGHIDA